MIDWDFRKRIALVGCLTAGVALSAFAYEWYIDGNLAARPRCGFLSAGDCGIAARLWDAQRHTTVWQMGLFSNLQLCVIVVASFALQLAIHHLPALQALFGTSPISLGQCAGLAGARVYTPVSAGTAQGLAALPGSA